MFLCSQLLHHLSEVRLPEVWIVMDRLPLGEILVKNGLINKQQIQAALELQRKERIKIGDALVKLGFVTDEEVLEALGEQFHYPVVDLRKAKISAAAIKAVPREVAEKHNLLPLKHDNGVLTIAIAEPPDLNTLDNLRFMLGAEIRCVLAKKDLIERALAQCYGGASKKSQEAMSKVIQNAETQEIDADTVSAEGAEEDDDEAPVIRLVHLLIREAVKARASDIHIEPMANKLRIRYRIDGVCHEVENPPKRLEPAILSRVKIMAGMDIAEKRRPQDGRIAVNTMGKSLDLRVSALPATHGESIVMRILEKESVLISLDQLGFDPADYKRFRRIIRRPNGVFLVTGPTGSGKTTTLYAALNELNRPDRKIITAEDPIEYHMTGVNQVQVNDKIGLTFAAILRAMLRQAPNIILVGEIRDRETAEIAVQAALTGHLVFSTLHTNDAPSAITRLIDMGVAPFLVASSVQAVMAQRLVRRICPNCKIPTQYEPAELMTLGIDPGETAGITFYRGKGCPHCSNTGFRGRCGIFEMMEMNNELREMAFRRESGRLIRRQARLAGKTTLEEDGARKVLSGITTLEEVIETTQREEELIGSGAGVSAS